MPENQQAQWYVAHTYSGYENKVKANLDKSVANNGLQDLIQEVRIPVEEVTEIRNGKPKLVQHKLLPGYVMVKMVMTNETWYIVRNTRGVTGFVGPGSKPEPLSEEDFASLTEPKPETRLDIQVGDEVRILSGSFENFTGKVESINIPENKVSVVVSMLKRDLKVDFAIDEVVRLEN